jgi:hypothetical protein
MFKSLLRDKLFLSLLAFTIFIKLLSLNEAWVERYYTYGFYPYVSRTLRFLFGWLPFSIGDILYIVAVIYLVYKAVKFLRVLAKRQVKQYLRWVLVKKLLHLALWIYLIFNVFWGLNYNRLGMAAQLQLDVKLYTVQDLDTLTATIQSRLNQYATMVDSTKREAMNKNHVLFNEGVAAYREIKKTMPYLVYQNPSVKPSMFSHIGHYFGFTGYYNPFTGEAQIKTTAPFFIKPFVTTHEIGHQLGYAKENEANFVAFFAGRSSANPEFRYSVYFEMYLYAIRDLSRKDSSKASEYKAQLHPQVKKDSEELIAYLIRSENPVEPWVTRFYDEFLKMNNQPKGKMTYNEVVAWLIAYQKKFGREAI